MFEILFPALLTGLLLSLITAPLGAFVVWRKMAYFGDTLSHSALLGVALGIFLQINPYVAIVILTIILAVLMVWLESNTQFFSGYPFRHYRTQLSFPWCGYGWLTKKCPRRLNELSFWGFARH